MAALSYGGMNHSSFSFGISTNRLLLWFRVVLSIATVFYNLAMSVHLVAVASQSLDIARFENDVPAHMMALRRNVDLYVCRSSSWSRLETTSWSTSRSLDRSSSVGLEHLTG